MNELTISLNTNSEVPLYEQIYQYIKQDIQKGHIQAGDKIPSTRSLSKYLEVSRSTVELAYEQLVSEGYIEAEPYRGYYATQIDNLYRQPKAYTFNEDTLGFEEEKICYRYDFSPFGKDLKNFPFYAWRKLSKNILNEEENGTFRLGNSQGEIGLRKTICKYLYQARGMNCSPEQVIVGAGNDYMLMLLHLILGNDQVVAFENPTYKQAYQLFENLGYKVLCIDMDKRGLMVEKLKKTDANIAYVMPSHQYPMGTVMPIPRRQELLRWAEKDQNRFIIEDDYDSEFRYKGKPIPALQGIDSGNKVIYLGTFSKAIAPSIRMSYMVLPERLVELYHKRCDLMSSSVSMVDQLIVQRFMEAGYQERHLNKSRAMYKGRHDMLINALRPLTESGICKISGENAGVHLVLQFSCNISESQLIESAREKGIRIYGLSEYALLDDNIQNPGIILGYANLNEQQIERAVIELRNVWSKLL